MNGKTWQLIRATSLVVAVLLIAGCARTAPAQDIPDEATLCAVLKSDDGWLEKQTACRGLRVKGTTASIPILAALLPDEKLSHMARYALEPMPYPEAGQALRDALAKTEGMPKAGVIISIGARRDAEAVPLLIPLMKDPNPDIARAAIGALGRIATPEAQDAMLQYCSAVSEPLRLALAEGLLALGQRLPQKVKPDATSPMPPLYQELISERWPMFVRMGAFRGWAYADPEKTSTIVLIAMLGHEPPEFRDMASQIIAETSGEKATRFYAEALTKNLPPDGLVALLRGLADRKDVLARPEVARLVESSDKNVKIAAVKALGTLGNGADVPALAGLLASEDAELAAAANASLGAMQAPDVNAAIAESAPKASPAARAKLLDLLGNRQADQTIAVATKSLDDADVAVRVAALRELAPLAGKDHVPTILQLLVKATDAAERAAAEKTLCGAASRVPDDKGLLPLVLDAMNGVTPETRIALLHVVARIGTPKALETILATLADANSQFSDEAVRMLSEWPALDAVPHLLKLAQSDDLNRQVLGLRGYVRLAGIEPSMEERARMLTTAMTLAKRPDEKKLVLGTWGAVPTVQSLEVLRPHLDDTAVQNEAALAIIAVAPELAKNETTKPNVIEALKAAIEKCADRDVRKRAQKALAPLQ